MQPITRLAAALCAVATLCAHSAAQAAPIVLYESDLGTNSIQWIDETTGAVHPFVSGLDGPRGMAFDAAGDMYVANVLNNTIDEISPSGQVSLFASASTPGLSGMLGPEDVAVYASGNVWVADAGSFSGDPNTTGTIYEIAPDGSSGTLVESGIQTLRGIVFDSSGNLFASGSLQNGGDIYELTTGDVFQTFATGLDGPEQMAFDAAGNLFVADNLDGSIAEITPGGSVSTYVAPGNGLFSPVGVAFGAGGTLFVSDNDTDAVDTAAGGTVTTFATGLNGPRDLLSGALTVPEPSALALLLPCAAALFVRRRV